VFKARAVINRRLFVAGAAPFVAGCVSEGRLPAAPHRRAVEMRDDFMGLPNARFLVGARNDDILKEWVATESRYLRSGGGDYHLLALSGGGENGAFGAGLLYGWGERGDRPVFEMVTGVSTGALIAPLVFLGKRYDDELKRLFTTISAADVLTTRPLITAFFSDALSDTTPLMHLIERALTDDMIRAIGAEYRRGRFLIIGTTNLDLSRQVIWNIGALAETGRAEAFQAIRRILLASAAIPALFPPVLFNVTVDGEPRQELHVDGGAAAQLFLYPTGIRVQDAPAALRRRRRHAWVIRNGRTRPPPEETPRRLLDITNRSISTLIDANSLGDIYRIYLQTQRDRVDFNLAYITGAFTRTPSVPFETAYMNELFEFGRRRVKEGRIWSKVPPGFAT
jgi:predicted acylesterase/phospholipase RssA